MVVVATAHGPSLWAVSVAAVGIMAGITEDQVEVSVVRVEDSAAQAEDLVVKAEDLAVRAEGSVAPVVVVVVVVVPGVDLEAEVVVVAQVVGEKAGLKLGTLIQLACEGGEKG